MNIPDAKKPSIFKITIIGEYPDRRLERKEKFELLDFDFYRALLSSVIWSPKHKIGQVKPKGWSRGLLKACLKIATLWWFGVFLSLDFNCCTVNF